MTLEKSFEKERLEKEVKQVLRNTEQTLDAGGNLSAAARSLPRRSACIPEIKKLTRLYKMARRDLLAGFDGQIGNPDRPDA